MQYYSPRFDVPRSRAMELIEKLHKILKPKEYHWNFEIATETQKEHIHGYLGLVELPWQRSTDSSTSKAKQRQLQKFMEELDLYKGKGCYSFAKTKRDSYIGYINKDGDLLKSNLSKEKVEKGVKEYNENKAKAKKAIFPQIVDYVASEEMCVNSVYKCQVAVMSFYMKMMDSVPNSRNLLNYLSHRVYLKFNQPTPEDMLEISFGIVPDKKEKNKSEIENLNLLLDKLKHRQEELEYDIDLAEKLKEYDQKKIDNLL